METSSQDVLNTFGVTDAARESYQQWANNPLRLQRGVVHTVMNHVSRVVYRLSKSQVQAVCDETDHALGNIKKKDIEGIASARDWYPAYAFVHLFHFLMEKLQEPPRWQDFEEFAYRTELGREMFGEEKLRQQELIKRQHHPRIAERYSRVRISVESLERKVAADAENALQWRVGNAYYGFLRDIYTVVHLRERGLDVQTHPLADALFRTDCWIDRSIVSLYIGNRRYRAEIADRHEGRKQLVDDLLRDAGDRFAFVPITLPAADRFGEVFLPDEASLDTAETAIKDAGRG